MSGSNARTCLCAAKRRLQTLCHLVRHGVSTDAATTSRGNSGRRWLRPRGARFATARGTRRSASCTALRSPLPKERSLRHSARAVFAAHVGTSWTAAPTVETTWYRLRACASVARNAPCRIGERNISRLYGLASDKVWRSTHGRLPIVRRGTRLQSSRKLYWSTRAARASPV